MAASGANTGTAPYNFVPFGTPVLARDVSKGETLSGHFDLTLTPLTPLFIGGGQQADGSSLRWPGTERQWIPGSSIRGAVIAIASALLGGPVPAEDARVYARSPFPPKDGRNGTEGTRSPDSIAFHKAYATRRRPVGNYSVNVEKLGLLTRVDATWKVTPAKRLKVRWNTLNACGMPPDVPRLRRDASGAVPSYETILERMQFHRVEFNDADLVTDEYTWTDRRTGNQQRRRSPIERITKLRLCSSGSSRLLLVGLAGKASSKHPLRHAYVAQAKNVDPLGVDDAAIDALLEYTNGRPGLEVAHDHLAAMKDGTRRGDDDIPVFYDVTGDSVTALGFSGGFAIPGNSTWRQAAERAWVEHRDAQPDDLYAVEALFGTVRPRKDNAVRSIGLAENAAEVAVQGRVEFGHALSHDEAAEKLTSQRVTMSTPNRTSVHTRLKPPGGGGLATFFDDTAKVRGREFYWHRWEKDQGDEDAWLQAAEDHRQTAPGEIAGDQHLGEKQSKSNGLYTPTKSGVKHQARVFFRDLTQLELGVLTYALTLGAASADPRDAERAHKLGGLKPLGLGTVHIAAALHLDNADRLDTWEGGWGSTQAPKDLTVYIDAFRGFINQQGLKDQLDALERITAWKNAPSRTLTHEMSVVEHAQRRVLKEIKDVLKEIKEV